MDPIENSNNEENIEVPVVIEPRKKVVEQNILKPVSKDSFRINVVCKCGVCPDCVFYDSEKSGSENEKEIIEAFSGGTPEGCSFGGSLNQVNMEKIEEEIYHKNEVYNIHSPFEGINPKNKENITIEIEEPIEEPIEENISKRVPKLIFIVPYRDRETQLSVFSKHMKMLLEDVNSEDYIIHYAHQCDKRSFNRGAMKNIGFIAMKNKYPNDYKNISFIFNDVDTMPSIKGMINYETTPGVVKHFYGYLHTLGGIVSIKGSDFERVNGFPQYWAWGFEDNLFYRRVFESKIIIDRQQFYKIEDDRIIHLKNGTIRDINSGEFQRYLQQNKEGITNINNLIYDIDTKGFINIRSFSTGYEENLSLKKEYDIQNGPSPFKVGHPMRRGTRMHMIF